MGRPEDDRVLVCSPGRDGQLTCDLLTKSGLACEPLASLERLLDALREGAGALIVGEEVLERDEVASLLVEQVSAQPPWSDLPVIVVTKASERAGRSLRPLDLLGNVSILTRPMSVDSLVTAVRSALRARRRQYEVRELLAARDEADRRKDEFLAMLAHELRNPLAPIRSGAHLLGEDADPELLRQVREIIEHQVAHLARLVDDLLDVARVTRGKVELRRSLVDLRDVAGHAAKTAEPAAADKRQRLCVSLPPSPLFVDADVVRLEQVLTNLLTNAVRYTPPGGTVTLAAEADGDAAVVTVRDDGAGIDPAFLPHVFDLFSQSGRSVARSEGGLGIGLTVVRKLAELHGGDVRVESDGPGTGTTATLRLPLVRDRLPDHGPPPAAPVAATGRRLSVLVVEDNRPAAMLLARLIRAGGHDVRVAPDGASGLAAAAEATPDLALLDIGLPDMAGTEVAARLRADGCRDAMIVAVSGYERSTAAGMGEVSAFDRYVKKPIEFAELQDILRTCQGRTGPVA